MGFRQVVLSLVVLAASLACRAPPAPSAPLAPVAREAPVVAAPVSFKPQSWSVVSSRGRATLSQSATRENECSLACVIQGKPTWERPDCLARDTDFAFVSDDCGTALVLLEYPLRADPAEATVVAAALKHPAPPVFFTVGQILPELKGGESRRVRWLAGVVGEPGDPPRQDTAGTAVELATLDGARRTMRFASPEDLLVAPHRPAPAEPVAAPAPAPEPVALPPSGTGLYRYVGADGSTEFVMGLDQVPARFRKSARPVQADVSAVKGEPPPRRAPITDPPPMQPQHVIPNTVRSAPPPRAQPTSNCVFGLSGPACDAVRNAERQSAENPQGQ